MPCVILFIFFMKIVCVQEVIVPNCFVYSYYLICGWQIISLLGQDFSKVVYLFFADFFKNEKYFFFLYNFLLPK